MRVIFLEFGVTVAASSLKDHMERHHGISVLQTMEVEIGWGGGGGYLCGFLFPDAEYGEMPSDSLSGSSAWRGLAEGTLHVQTFFLVDGGGKIGERYAVLQGLGWHVHARGAAYQAPEDAKV